MKTTSILAAVTLALAPVPTQAKPFDCVLRDTQIVNEGEGGLSGSVISFPEKSAPWSFRLVTTERTTTIEWPASPIQLDGESPRIQTGPTSFASFHVGRGPCLFTEGHCGAIVHYSEQPDGSLSLLVQPIALTRMDDDMRVPFLAYMPGTCTAENDE